MTSRRLPHILTLVKELLFSTFNREFLIFLFFLVLSAAYWLMSVLNDTVEREITVPVQLVGVPDNVIMLNSDKIDVRLTVRDKGYTIAAYRYGDRINTVRIPFSTYAVSQEKCSVGGSELQKLLAAQLYASSKIVSVRPSTLEFPFNYGLNKRVPIKLIGKVRPADSYYLARIKFQPESVYIYSSEMMLDSVQYVMTEPLNITNFTDTIEREVALQRMASVKMVPENVTMTLYPDIMIEAVTQVPITAINVPAGCVLRPFPPQVQVHYAVGASQYNTISVSNFTVVADYNNTEGGTTEKCPLRLIKSPRSARAPRLSLSQVDYLIER